MKKEDKELRKALANRDFSLTSNIHMQYQNTMYSQNRIITTGYIDDEEKTILYLNSLAMVNSSLIEGLGLPVLDAACLGLKSIVSDCDSHKEISSLYDFSDYLVLKNILRKQDWINSLIALGEQSLKTSNSDDNSELHVIRETIKSRIDRYLSMKQIISHNYMKSISSLFNT
jgi:glycosyltransferase involved in cell wall biosynthesis